MAYLRSVPRFKCQACGKTASQEVVNVKNGHVGYYCAKDAVAALVEQQRREVSL